MEGKRGEQSCSPLAGIWAEIPSGAVTAKQEQDRARGDDQAPGSVVAGGFKQTALAGFGGTRRAGVEGGWPGMHYEWLRESCWPDILP